MLTHTVLTTNGRNKDEAKIFQSQKLVTNAQRNLSVNICFTVTAIQPICLTLLSPGLLWFLRQ